MRSSYKSMYICFLTAGVSLKSVGINRISDWWQHSVQTLMPSKGPLSNIPDANSVALNENWERQEARAE